ncbi:hypothetical protein Tco_0397696 [Tanacetum coccineum]
MAIPEDHLAKFHKMTDAKEMWEAIKSRFGGNDESKKMHKYILKQQFESFSVSNLDGLHKGYDRFQSLLSQLEIHGAGVFTEDANQKFLRRDGLEMASGHDFHEIEEVLQEDMEKAVGTLPESTDQKEIKKAEGEMQGTLDIKQKTIGGDLEGTRMNPKALAYNNSELRQLGLSKLLNSQMSTRDKSGLGSSDVEDSPVNDRFGKVEGMHAVPPPMTGNYVPPKFDFGIDESNFTYGPKQSKTMRNLMLRLVILTLVKPILV